MIYHPVNALNRKRNYLQTRHKMCEKITSSFDIILQRFSSEFKFIFGINYTNAGKLAG
jgi:hypothetical protein